MRRALVLGLVLVPLWGCTQVGQTISNEAENPRNEVRTQPRGAGDNGGSGY